MRVQHQHVPVRRKDKDGKEKDMEDSASVEDANMLGHFEIKKEVVLGLWKSMKVDKLPGPDVFLEEGNLASLAYVDGDHYDALRDCLKAISLNPSHLKAHFRLARCLFELKYVTEALECLDDFKGRFPEQAHSSACDALDRDIKAVLFAKTDTSDEKKAGTTTPIRIRSSGRKDSISDDEVILRERGYDYKSRYCGHCNTTTDIKEANFFGSNGQYIVSGSDDGSFFIWEKETTNLVRVLQGDESI
eukprot:g44459.t1